MKSRYGIFGDFAFLFTSRVLRLVRLLVLGIFTPLASWSQPISFSDANLEQAVRAALNYPSEGITVENIQALTNLTASFREITSVEGLEYAHNLANLDLSFNLLAAVNFQPGLSNLVMLKLNGNGMTALQLAPDMVRLRILDLAENDLHDFSSLGNCPALAVLNLQYNNLTNVELPTNLTALLSLDLGYNQVREFSFLAPFTELSVLNLDDNGLRTLTLPPPLANISTLTLAINRLTNFAFLSQLPFLSVLDLSANLLPSVQLPDGLALLNWVNLAENRLTYFRAARGLDALGTLLLGDNLLTNVCLDGLSSVERLDVARTQLRQLTILPDMLRLHSLGLRFTPLTQLTLPDELATNALAQTVADLSARGVEVRTYAAGPRWELVRQPPNSATGSLRGAPGVYELLRSTDLSKWTGTSRFTNQFGTVSLTLPIGGHSAEFFQAFFLHSLCP